MADDNICFAMPISPIVKSMCQNPKGVGVLTSGGDSQGMNSAIRAVVRQVLSLGSKCFIIREGYSGLLNNDIEEAKWSTVANITHLGGSMIGTSRCDAFRTYEGRKKAAKNMFDRSMFHLIVIGGDGSLTGASKLKDEWSKIGEELFADGSITEQLANEGRELRLVGIVGSIDNDCIETDKSIGSDTALHRICEAIDSLRVTAHSHQRVFIVEVMGRHCGYLALTTALAVEADFVFYPEFPPAEQWPEQLCQQLERVRKLGKRQNVIIFCEGARNSKGEKLEAKTVKNEIETRLQVEVRVANLGHIQRGGTPSFLDRLLGLRMGYDAVQELFRTDTDGSPLTGLKNVPKVMCLRGHYIAIYDLSRVLKKSESVHEEAKQGNFDLACKLRGSGFLNKTRFVNYMTFPLAGGSPRKSKVFGIIHIGSPVAGMNAVTFAFTRMANHSNIEVVGIRGAWDGLKNLDTMPLTWANVQGWAQQGGSLLGAKRQLPSDFEEIARAFNDTKIDGLAIVGGFLAFQSALLIQKRRSEFSAFNIPIVVVPATISNNCPGTCVSLGADTALNEICRQVDNIRQSAIGSKNKVMIIETMGSRSGYLASMAALATGSDCSLIHQAEWNEDDVHRIAKEAEQKLKDGKMEKYVIIKSEGASDTISAVKVKKILDSEFKGKVSVRITNLGYSQLGGVPSCFDRQMGIRMGIRAFEGIVNPNKMGKRDCCVIGLRGNRLKYVPIFGLETKVCMIHNLPLNLWWLDIHPLVEHLTKKPKFLPSSESVINTKVEVNELNKEQSERLLKLLENENSDS